MGKWKKVEEHKPTDFVSVLGHMTDAGEFPSVRECYLIDGQHFFFPALNAVHPVDKWKEMPPAIDTPAVDAVEWISVKDRLPDENTLVLCAGAKGGMFLGKIRWIYEEDGTAYCHVPNARSGRSATHWHPLPEPPKEV